MLSSGWVHDFEYMDAWGTQGVWGSPRACSRWWLLTHHSQCIGKLPADCAKSVTQTVLIMVPRSFLLCIFTIEEAPHRDWGLTLCCFLQGGVCTLTQYSDSSSKAMERKSLYFWRRFLMYRPLCLRDPVLFLKLHFFIAIISCVPPHTVHNIIPVNMARDIMLFTKPAEEWSLWTPG
jgi:hypothetical protein